MSDRETRYEDRPLDLTLRQAAPPPELPWWLVSALILVRIAIAFVVLWIIVLLVELFS